MSQIVGHNFNCTIDIINTTNNATPINKTWTMVAFIGAILCSVIGFIVNIFTIYILWLIKNPEIIYTFHKVKRSFIPLLFFLCWTELVMCTFVLSTNTSCCYLSSSTKSIFICWTVLQILHLYHTVS